MSYLLMVWIVVGVTPSGYNLYDWQTIGEFQQQDGYVACQNAAKQLKLAEYRCVAK